MPGSAQSDPSSTASAREIHPDHPRGRHGGIVYDLAPFGLDRDALWSALGSYADHFGVAREG